MQINLLNLFTVNEKDYLLDTNLEQDYIMLDGKPSDLLAPASIKGKITRIDKDDYSIRLDVGLSYKTVCDRCAKEVQEDLDIHIDKDISLNSDEEEYLSGSVLDLEEMVLEEIYSNLPVKTLCDEECKGLCLKCGKDLNEGTCDCEDDNIDPRLAKLKDLFKEV